MAETILNRVKDAIGDNVDTQILAVSDYINESIAEIADIVPPNLFLKYLNAQGFVADTSVGGVHELDDSPTSLDVSDKKILTVYREDGSLDRNCMQVNFSDAISKYVNPNSSFKATKLSPIWYTASGNINNGFLNVFPLPTSTDKAYVYYFTHPSQVWDTETGVDTGIKAAENEGISGSSVTLTTTSGARQASFKDKKVYKSDGTLFGTCTSVTATDTIVFSGGISAAISNADALYTSGYHDTSIPGFPNELIQSVVYRAAMTILQSYISNAVQEDEDVEMQQMLNTQLQALSAAYKQEISRFLEGGGS